MRKQISYALYQGKEYSFTKLQNGNFRLISENPEDLKNGFIFYDEKIFKRETGFIPKNYPFRDTLIKDISRDQIEAAYTIRTFAKYKGYNFTLDEEKDNKYLIGTSNFELCKELELTVHNKVEYEKWVDKDEVEVFEVIDRISDFPLPEEHQDNEKDEDKI